MNSPKKTVELLIERNREIIEKFFIERYVGQRYISQFIEGFRIYLLQRDDTLNENASDREIYMLLLDYFIVRMKRLSKDICSRNEQAWELFKYMFEPMFYRILTDMNILGEDTRREIVQEFYLYLLRKCKENKLNYEGKALLSSYLHRTFRNFLINLLERDGSRIPHRSLDEIYEMGRDIGYADKKDICETIISKMKALKFEEEDILLITLMCDGYNQSEIAKIMGRSSSFISKRKDKIFRALRKNLSLDNLLS